MNFCTPINKKSVIISAMSLLSEAKKTIYVTMKMQSEVDHPLPKKYHNLITQLAKHNISINRYMFGEKKLFNKLRGRFDGVHIHYGGEMELYQRMLIVDKKKGLFALNNKVFFTDFKPLIKSLLKYVKIL